MEEICTLSIIMSKRLHIGGCMMQKPSNEKNFAGNLAIRGMDLCMCVCMLVCSVGKASPLSPFVTIFK